jgi:surface polysaccharide O-acyltransferase-like enzyme
MAIAYVVWSAFYAIVPPISKMIFTEEYQASFVEIIGSFISGAYHLWFLPMIIGLYMCIPLIKQLIKNDNLIKYFLLLSIIFCFIKTQIDLVTNNLLISNVQIIFENVTTVFKNFNVGLVVGYVSYFILGFYLNKTEISKKHRTIIYILGFAGLVLTIILNLFASKNAGRPSEEFYDSFSLNVFLMSVAIFIWFKYNAKGTERLNKIIFSLSKYSFGAYLVHVFIIQSLTAVGFSSETFHPLFSVPAITIFTTIMSYLISLVLNKIPIIKKYIV